VLAMVFIPSKRYQVRRLILQTTTHLSPVKWTLTTKHTMNFTLIKALPLASMATVNVLIKPISLPVVSKTLVFIKGLA
jgi:hypothetical protein